MYNRLFTLLLIIAALSLSRSAGAQSTTTTALTVKLGVTPVTILVHEGPSGRSFSGTGVVFVNVHDNENEAVEAALAVIARDGGRLVELCHGGTRKIRFQLNVGGAPLCVDPNRMFTSIGIHHSLECEATDRKNGEKEVALFASRFMEDYVLDGGKTKFVIAVHNNSVKLDKPFEIGKNEPGYFSPDKKNPELSLSNVQIASTIAKATGDKSSSDFVIVTQDWLLNLLSPRLGSVGLQDNDKIKAAADRKPEPDAMIADGSMSVYFALIKPRIPYVNVEAIAHDPNHLAVTDPNRPPTTPKTSASTTVGRQVDMLEAILKVIDANRSKWNS